jgi:hypothetical protein
MARTPVSTVSVPLDSAELARAIARREDRTVIAVIRRALEAYEAAHREEKQSA